LDGCRGGSRLPPKRRGDPGARARCGPRPEWLTSEVPERSSGRFAPTAVPARRTGRLRPLRSSTRVVLLGGPPNGCRGAPRRPPFRRGGPRVCARCGSSTWAVLLGGSPNGRHGASRRPPCSAAPERPVTIPPCVPTGPVGKGRGRARRAPRPSSSRPAREEQEVRAPARRLDGPGPPARLLLREDGRAGATPPPATSSRTSSLPGRRQDEKPQAEQADRPDSRPHEAATM